MDSESQWIRNNIKENYLWLGNLWGIYNVPGKKAYMQASNALARNFDSWKHPVEGSVKMNFDGSAKGNPIPAGFWGVIRNSEGKNLSVF